MYQREFSINVEVSFAISACRYVHLFFPFYFFPIMFETVNAVTSRI